MLSLFSQLFSSFAQASEKLFPQQIDLSGNIFHFSLPENFSSDMPAYDVVNRLDITDTQKFDNGEYGNLVRRWWDIKAPGWFGKKLGTVMMDISVQRVAANKQQLISKNPYDIRDRMDFILMLDESFHQRYDALNQELVPEDGSAEAYGFSFATVSREKIFSVCREKIFNDQKWIENSISAPRGDLIVVDVLPVTTSVYLEVSFTYSANDDVNLRDFLDTAFAKMEKIQDSFKVSYAPGNPFAKIVSEDWMEYTNTEVLEQHRGTILKLFYGPNPEAALLKMEQESRDSYDEYQRLIQEALGSDPQ